MKAIHLALFLLIATLGAISEQGAADTPSRQDPGDYERLHKEAEDFFAEASYARAHEIYLKADALELPPEDARWVDFRVADTLWRSEAGSQTADSTKLDQAQKQLDVLVRDIHQARDRDRVWVEVQESLADFWWTRRVSRNWGQAWPFYQRALDWWAGTEQIDEARRRYLGMVWKMAKPRDAQPHYYYGYYGNLVTVEILENVLEIAETDEDRAHAHYLIAMTLRHRGGDWNQRRRCPEEFEAALATGKATEWHDDALYQYGEWMRSYGRPVAIGNGQWRQEPDFKKALELYRRLIKEYRKGETRHFDQAKQQIARITRATLGVSVSRIFLPESEIQYQLHWRNIKRIDLSIFPVSLQADVSFVGGDSGSGSWIGTIDLEGREKVASWSFDTGDKGDHRPGQKALHLDKKLPMGAYVIQATGEGIRARDLILVSDASIVLKTARRKALVYVCNVFDGAPLPEANVKLWERRYDGRAWGWHERTKRADGKGLAVFDLPREKNDGRSRDFFVSAVSEARQAFSTGRSYYGHRARQPWRIYAFTDRPAYRPGETAHWKMVARRYDGSIYTTPANTGIRYEVTDPRGTKVVEGDLELNSFGSAWASLELSDTMPLGEYRVQFWSREDNLHIGNATLFRLEEYKLPEFKVTIRTPEEKGKRKAFKLGEPVEVSIEAEYYFGGPVANATVEALVYQTPFYHWWSPPREFPWFYEDMVRGRSPYRGCGGQIIKRETIKTDAEGKAKLSFDTPANAQQDFEYRVEARVTDASRREIVGSDTVRVTRQRYHVYLRPRHNLYRPQDKVTIDVKALDANEQPVQISGTFTVTRDYWFEVWLDPSGREVKGEALERLRAEDKVFPPPPRDPGGSPWRLKVRGYQHDEVLKRIVKTDAEGKAEVSFVPEREGYYRAAWSSQDEDGQPIQAQTTVWVATQKTGDLGYRQGAVEIILDRDTFRSGEKAVLMLSVPTNDRYVLFTVEAEELQSYRLIHVEGTVKLIELEIGERHVPNIFLSALMVSDRQIFMDTKQVVIPPVKHFLDVEVTSDREVYEPRQKGTLTIRTKDHEGKPVSAEVALGLVDESVYYIQADYAGDPRQFFYGTKRGRQVQTHSTFQQKMYSKLGIDKAGELFEVAFHERDGQTWGDVGNEQRFAGHKMRKEAVGGFARSGEVAAKMSADVAESESAPGAPRARGPAESMSGGRGGGEEPAVQVRSDFRSTIIWQPEIVTDLDGHASIEVTFPDSLTGWKATARVLTQKNHFGIHTAETRTRKPLIARLQAPRFFVVGDEVTVSAVINNNTDEPISVNPSLEAEGVVVSGIVLDGKRRKGTFGPVVVPANGESRLDWAVSVLKPGEAKITVVADGGEYADAMERRYVVFEHGIDKLVAKAVKLRGKDVTVKIDIPKERRPGSTVLTVQVAPSMAVTMLDALPYLIDYPYGCTEQTMSRFLPAAITARTLKDLGLDPEAIMGKVFGGIALEHTKKTQPKGKKNLRRLDDMVKKGLERLYDFQHADGGWGWWKKGDSDHFMTAYVVWGLALARDAGIEIRDDVLSRGVKYLDVEIVEEELNPDLQAWMLHGLAVAQSSGGKGRMSPFQSKAYQLLWKGRDRLNAYTRALLALAAHHFGEKEAAETLVRNLENGVKIDRTPDTSVVQRGEQESHEAVIGTAHWGEDGIYWRWSDGGVEATSFALRAILTVDPKNELIEPVTNWLIKNRRGAQWSNTRDTAITILALTQYLEQSGELNPEMEYELFVNGTSVVKKKLTSEDALTAPSRFSIDRELIRNGTNEIRVVRSEGAGAIYFSAEARFFSLEEPVTPAGNEIFVRRQYHKWVGRPTLLKGYIYERQPLSDGDTVTSGDRVEATITIEAKNNYEYLVFEDLKPAGLEAVQIRSGEPLYARQLKSGTVTDRFEEGNPGPQVRGPAGRDGADYTGRSRWVYQELRDRKVALFIDKLAEGVWEIRYDLRAEVPGKFHALPVKGHAMYVPEIRCNGVEIRIAVEDKAG